MTALAIAVGLQWLVTIVLAIMVILLYRQFGLLYLGSGARVRMQGTEVGQLAPAGLIVGDVDMGDVALDWSSVGPKRATLLLLTRQDCEITTDLVGDLDALAERWYQDIDFLLVDAVDGLDDPPREQRPGASWRAAVSPAGLVHKAFDIEVSPYAYVISSSGVVEARDIVNDGRGIEGLLQEARASRSGRRIPVQQSMAVRRHAIPMERSR